MVLCFSPPPKSVPPLPSLFIPPSLPFLLPPPLLPLSWMISPLSFALVPLPPLKLTWIVFLFLLKVISILPSPPSLCRLLLFLRLATRKHHGRSASTTSSVTRSLLAVHSQGLPFTAILPSRHLFHPYSGIHLAIRPFIRSGILMCHLPTGILQLRPEFH